MSEPSKAGSDAIQRATVTEPGTGNWTIDLDVTTDEELSDTIAVSLSGSAFQGAIVRGAVDGGTWSGRIEGGSGGIQGEIVSRSYSGATVAMILNDIASDSGEKISGEILPALSATALAAWVRPVGKASRAVADLAMNLGLNWRITRAGEIWIGEESYQSVTGLEYTQLSQGASDSVIIAPQEPLVSPGDLFLSREVSDVITELTPDALSQKVIFKANERSGIAAIVTRLFDRMLGRRIDCSASYPAKVILQRGDDSLDVIVDHPRFAGEGIKSVPIRLGIPGARCEVNKGARVRIHFDEQDQSKPFAALWDTSAGDVTLIDIGGAGSAEFLTRDDKLQSLLDNLKTWMDGHTHLIGSVIDSTASPCSGVTGAPAAGSPSVADTACATLKAK